MIRAWNCIEPPDEICVLQPLSFFIMRMPLITLIAGFLLLTGCAGTNGRNPRTVEDFDQGWRFHPGDLAGAQDTAWRDSSWQQVMLPHDWSILGAFSKESPTTTQEAALPAGIGWYRKRFTLPEAWKNKRIYLDFGGVYRDSKVWVNGHFVGERPNGFISFRYLITTWVHFGARENVVAVRVDNSLQPNARWYTGSGIYRHVRMIVTSDVAVIPDGVFVTTPRVEGHQATVHVQTTIGKDAGMAATVMVESVILDASGDRVAHVKSSDVLLRDTLTDVAQDLRIERPRLWSPDDPYLYRVVTRVTRKGRLTDEMTTPLGIRYFRFREDSGFFLNGRHLQIRGVCLHDDLGGLGTAVSAAAVVRRLRLLKAMGCNAIRTAHNQPSRVFLNAADSMGFLVMEDAFDVWRKKKVKYDYHLYWDRWHRRDLRDQILRDRNHPSVVIWDIGNEIREQFDSSGIPMTRELAGIVRGLDPTRPVTSALTETDSAKNFIYRSGALDVVGLNYNQRLFPILGTLLPGRPLIATEDMSALETRGYYEMPSDSIRRLPASAKAPFTGNADYAVSAYDNRSAYWGSTHEETLSAIARCPGIAGLFVWTGFDYLGEPTPYPWPARSAYFGIIDLAGFPKDAYYLYQSLWTDTPVLHIFPDWNWKKGDTVDVWAYYNDADKVELFLNGKSLGARRKRDGALHVVWRVPFSPGVLRAVSSRGGKTVLTREIRTAGAAAKLVATADRTHLSADGKDLSFITVRVEDSSGNLVPHAASPVRFEVGTPGVLAATNNGYQADLESFRANPHRAFNGLVLGVVRTTETPGAITVRVGSPGLAPDSVTLYSTR